MRAELRRKHGENVPDAYFGAAEAVFLKNKPAPWTADLDWVSLETLINELTQYDINADIAPRIAQEILVGYTELQAVTRRQADLAKESQLSERRRFKVLEVGFAAVFSVFAFLVFLESLFCFRCLFD
ncbi:MAG: hypothetical protein AAF229_05600 [Pseudomonadota bacterium]